MGAVVTDGERNRCGTHSARLKVADTPGGAMQFLVQLESIVGSLLYPEKLGCKPRQTNEDGEAEVAIS